MTEFISSAMSYMTNSVFISGVVCGISLSWFIIKSKSESMKPISNDENISTAGKSLGSEDDNYKLVLIVRTDLKMGKGKAAAQCAHAAVMAYKQAKRKEPRILKEWEDCGQAKVVLKVETEEEMLQLATCARANGLMTSIVCDAGRTQIASGSKTVLGIGPGPVDLIDEVSGHLKLF